MDTYSEFTADQFSIELPASARHIADPAGSWFTPVAAFDHVARCDYYCIVEIGLHPHRPDHVLSTFVETLTAAAPDEPEAADYAPVVVDSFTMGGRQAYVVEYWCGDCQRRALLVDGDAAFAEIAYELDARDYTLTRMEALHKVAKTFRWRTDP